jgi:hypothetical protein
VLAGVEVEVSPEIADATPDRASPTEESTLPSPESVEVVELSNVTCLLTTLGK